MIKVNLQNTAVQNMLTGQNTLDSVFIDGNSILFIEKPEYLKQLYRDEIKARAIKVNLKVAREEIHKRTQDDRYNNLDDMETLKKFRAQTDELRETEKEYRRMLGLRRANSKAASGVIVISKISEVRSTISVKSGNS